MSSVDLATILSNVAQSLHSVHRLITGFAFIMGITFFMIALKRFKNMAGTQHSQEKFYTSVIYVLIGGILLYLPSGISTLSSSLFGADNLFAYSTHDTTSIYDSMLVIVQTIGIIWFIRGCSLIVHSDQPGAKDGRKGLLFIIAGIFFLNFENTIAMLGFLLMGLFSWTHG